MKKVIFFVLSLQFCGSIFSQGITLLYRGPLGWYDQNSWIQMNPAAGQQPISRVPTEIDDVVFSKSLSGYSTFQFSHSVIIGGGAGSLCRSIHVSNMELNFEEINAFDRAGNVEVYTGNGGFVLADSGANIRHGLFTLHGGNLSITDLQIINSNYGDLFTHAVWSSIELTDNAKARFINSNLEGDYFKNNSPGARLYADSCFFMTPQFTMGDSTTDTLLNSSIETGNNFVTLSFFIGRNANFTSANNTVSAFNDLGFITSGSVFNGNVNLEQPGFFLLGQEDAANPLPNIINGNFTVGETYGIFIKGDLKISGNFILNTVTEAIFNDTSSVFVNGQTAFVAGGLAYLNNNHCRLEFFGNTSSNVVWPLGFPVDTLVVNKSACAKVTFKNSLYVLGAARIMQGQLALDPNDAIPYKFVCIGDLEIMQGGGIFLRKNILGVTAGMAIQGNLYDHNQVADTSCLGISNPYLGNITLYHNSNNRSNNIIDVPSIANLHLIGRPGSGFALGNDLTVYDFINIEAGELDLNNHKLFVKSNLK